MNPNMPVYYRCNMSKGQHILAYIIASLLMTVIAWLFYHILSISLIVGFLVGIYLEKMYAASTVRKRQKELRMQFRDFMESMSVAARAGNVEVHALKSALKDLMLSYSENSDIVVEVRNILQQYEMGGIEIKELFNDFAKRSRVEDIKNFATIYGVIEGKSDRFGDILVETASIIRDKLEIEQEIETTITSAKSESNAMLIMPIIIVVALGSMGGELMGALFTTWPGHIAATIAIACFIISFVISQKVTDIKV